MLEESGKRLGEVVVYEKNGVMKSPSDGPKKGNFV
jgi:hypothetical protein